MIQTLASLEKRLVCLWSFPMRYSQLFVKIEHYISIKLLTVLFKTRLSLLSLVHSRYFCTPCITVSSDPEEKLQRMYGNFILPIQLKIEPFPFLEHHPGPT